MRPSELYKIRDELSGFYFDRAVTTFGLALEADLDRSSKNAKTTRQTERLREKTLNNWLDIKSQQFRDPATGGTPNSDQTGIVQL